MSRVRRRDSAPELKLRSELHRRGLRFHVDTPVPGMRRRRVDILFTRARVAILVDGCFWHGCPQHGVAPKANAEWWRRKIEGNRARDEETNQILQLQGYHVFRVWEHEDPLTVAPKIEAVVRARVSRQNSDPE